MNILMFMIPVTLIMAFLFLGFFIWAAKSGQFDDLVTPSHEILLEDENVNESKEIKQQETSGDKKNEQQSKRL
ncbi:MAG: cbb3-type cytochrome oxidase assembly protein CcoS [Bdellovibrionaceae bacterium]|jgi:cbb3-type cytochrome oxidase maturation protein|nr:cbb3-type cytochrome oxidase assembly protein CcoS [Pseudobdellovibrionaceae bacterium]